VGDWTAGPAELGLGSHLPVSIAKRRLHGGRQEGVDLVTIDNGQIALTLIPTRGMGVLNVQSAGLRLGWDSPIREVIHPQFVNLESRGGLGWLQGFNEWLVRCGLEFAGGPGRDRFITNTGDQAEMDLTLHGKIANIPASEVEVLVDPQPPHRLRVRGRVAEAMFYGPKLELWTELSTEPGSSSFRLEDSITNQGASDQEFELIYHINFGPPLLEAGARFIGAMQRVSPMNAHAAKSVGSYATYQGPTAGFVEQVYCMEPLADGQGRTTVLLVNASGDRAASLSYSIQQLPCFTLWKNTSSIEEGCVTGLEPGTNYPYNRRIERLAGRLSKLKPGQSRSFTLDFGLHHDRASVDRIATQINAIQAGRKTHIDPEPLPLPQD
jgi:hypothetical protein